MGKKNKFKGFFGNIPRAKLNYFLILENYSNKFVGETMNGAVVLKMFVACNGTIITTMSLLLNQK